MEKENYEKIILDILNKDEALSKEFIMFSNALLDAAGFSDFPLSLKSKMVMDISMRLKSYLVLRMLDRLPPEAFKELDEFIERLENSEEIQNEDQLNKFKNFYKEFWFKYIPDFNDFIANSIKDFANLFLKGPKSNT
ncbi:MAG: hypothetical protein QXJ20_02585 [Candidatus Aenigmatarchaeota archaeon]